MSMLVIHPKFTKNDEVENELLMKIAFESKLQILLKY